MVCAHAMLWLKKRSQTTIPCSQEMKEDRGVKECGVIRPGEYHDREQNSPYTQFSKSDMREIERLRGRRLANRPLSLLSVLNNLERDTEAEPEQSSLPW